MRHYCRNFAIHSYRPDGGIGQTRFISDGNAEQYQARLAVEGSLLHLALRGY